MVPCRHDGYVIGDGILFYLDKDELLFVGRAPTVNWMQFHAQRGDFKADGHPRRSVAFLSARQGGHAPALPLPDQGGRRPAQMLAKLNGGPLPDVKFFSIDTHQDQGPAGALRCVMAWRASRVWRSQGRTEQYDEDSRRHPRKRGRKSGWCRSSLAHVRTRHVGVRLDSFAAAAPFVPARR